MNEAPVRAAIDRLYEVFGRYPRPEPFDGCPCCFDGEMQPNGRLLVPPPGGERPLRSVTAAELRDVAGNVPMTGGSSEVLKHYLPRILELSWSGDLDFPEPEEILSHLILFEPTSDWPADERDGVRGFLQAALLAAMDTTDVEVVADWLCAAALVP